MRTVSAWLRHAGGVVGQCGSIFSPEIVMRLSAFRVQPGKLIIHHGPMCRRNTLATAAIVIFTAAALLMLGWFLASQGLDHAAAWSNILALPVGVIGVAVGVLAL